MRQPQIAFRAARRLPALAVLVGLTASAGLLARQAEPAAEANGPRANAPRRTIDLGVVSAGREATARFAIHNTGNAELLIHGVDTSCDCTVAEFDRSIAAGAIGYVDASLLTEALEGPVSKGILVRTNDPTHATLKFTLKALVKSRLTILPQPVVFMRERKGEGAVGRALIRPRAEYAQAFSVTDLRTSSATLVATARRLDAPTPRGGGLPAGYPGDWLIEVRFRDDQLVSGKLRELVRFRTGLAEQPSMSVEVESDL